MNIGNPGTRGIRFGKVIHEEAEICETDSGLRRIGPQITRGRNRGRVRLGRACIAQTADIRGCDAGNDGCTIQMEIFNPDKLLREFFAVGSVPRVCFQSAVNDVDDMPQRDAGRRHRSHIGRPDGDRRIVVRDIPPIHYLHAAQAECGKLSIRQTHHSQRIRRLGNEARDATARTGNIHHCSHVHIRTGHI